MRKMPKDLVVISLDQATETGYCVSIGDNIVEHGVVNCRGHTSFSDETAYHVGKFALDMIQKYKKHPIFFTFENVFSGNRKVYKFLARIQGALLYVVYNEEVLFKILHSRSWKSLYKIGGGKEGKQQSKEEASKIVNMEITDDNESDAICMNHFVRHRIKEDKDKNYNIRIGGNRD